MEPEGMRAHTQLQDRSQ